MRKISYRYQDIRRDSIFAISISSVFPISFMATTDFRRYKASDIQIRHHCNSITNRTIIDFILNLNNVLVRNNFGRNFYKDNLIILLSNQEAKDFYELCYKKGKK